VLRKIRYQGFRSLRDASLEPGALTLLIGPNAAGKSNVISGLHLIAEAVRTDVETALSRIGGAVEQVAFKGGLGQSFGLELDYSLPDPSAPHALTDMRYDIVAGMHAGRAAAIEERLKVKRRRSEPGAPLTWLSAKHGKGRAIKDPETAAREPFDTGQPGVLGLKALGFLDAFPRIQALRSFIEGWQLLAVHLDAVRAPRRAERARRLDTDGGNLANVLRTLSGTPEHEAIIEDLGLLLESVEGVDTQVDRGQIALLLEERYFDAPVEAFSISDGTLRLLCLVTALHLMPEHGLLCIEEPEHGVHPHVLGPLLDVIRARCPSEGTRQVLVTTHSADLVDAAELEEVVTVERAADGATRLARLSPKEHRRWLDDFRLGELWRMRQIGGVER